MKTLIIDNYDSFTFNLYQLVAKVNKEEPVVITNDQYSYQQIIKLNLDNIIISPGPGNPNNAKDFGVCKEIIIHTPVPILGVCLGHQGIGAVYGATITHAPFPFHGKLSKINHNNSLLFSSIPQKFEAVRYHSLIIDRQNFPEDLEKIAWTDDGLIMGVKHKEKPLWGVQFHPESILTQYGEKIIENFMTITKKYEK